jgi:Holliday junction DNA helicase RuvB
MSAGNTNQVAPQTFRHVLGQENVTKTLEMMTKSYFNDRAAGRRSSLPHLVFTGASGTGKTLMASILGKELATHMVECSGEAFFHVCTINEILLDLQEGDLLFIDEIHAVSDVAQTILLKALAEGKLSIEGGKSGKPKTIELAPFLCVGATTDEFKLHPAVLQRFFRLRFQPYSEGDLCKILLQRLPALQWQVEPGVLEMIASRSKRTPRIALKLLQSVYMMSRASNEEVITIAHVKEVMDMLQIDDRGLDPLEQLVLKTLADNGGGPIRLNVLAAKLGGISPHTLSAVVECDLIQQGLIDKKNDGRILTLKGWEHVHSTGLFDGPAF